ncbi:FMN-binding negative transcriptional regulator [Microbulbifer bruguierae]|uniref:FMN-binding negative transcriptional regulator n=1 Tax=Microbulbifer bruguierae TaxID=3029061 RepID=A0ABY8N826_9GAMM|nr:FMN-binding negative transcriptional regulator [Microbulbifer bruguierae]WGL15045.1 FMN-binding negative transcriptional regulator [Microbulbifer bruguierae]
MYTPNHFAVSDRQELLQFIHNNGFGALISNHQSQLQASHLPFLLDEGGHRLMCHLARQNDQLDAIDGHPVLVIFNGPHAYISPRWYTKPGVPTWNYQAVHVHGIARSFTDEQRLKTMVDSLSEKYESGVDAPWQPDYSPKLLRAIVGVEIEISEIQGTYKLSQNRPQQDRLQVVDALHAEGEAAMAQAIIQHNNP